MEFQSTGLVEYNYKWFLFISFQNLLAKKNKYIE